jgi:hypothetical protein
MTTHFVWDKEPLILDKSPSSFQWTASVKVKDYGVVSLYSSKRNQKCSKLFPVIPLKHYNISLLKSALQKCIRRGLAKSAVRIAYQLLFQDKNTFFRRFGVIMMEDCILQITYPKIIWWMMAVSKDWRISQDNLKEVLTIVYQTALHPLKEPIMFDEKSLEHPLTGDNLSKTLSLSILFRANYGGMKGDVKFLKHFSTKWSDRFSSNERSYWIKIVNEIPHVDDFDPITLIEVDLLSEDKILEAIDFHCFSNIPRRIRYIFPFYSEEDIKLSIWKMRSSISKKKLLNNETVDEGSEYKLIYSDIKLLLEEICQEIANQSNGWKGEVVHRIDKYFFI